MTNLAHSEIPESIRPNNVMWPKFITDQWACRMSNISVFKYLVN